MAVLGVSSITPAFPRIIREIGISAREVGLLISVFTAPGIIFTPVAGILGDRWGRKKIIVPALFLFGIAGGACALFPDFKLLLILRFFQGIGASALGALSLTIIGDLYSGKNRTVILGYNMSVLSVGTTIYPALGGALALFGWQYPFLLPLAAIPLGLLVLFLLKTPEPQNDQKFTEYILALIGILKNRQVLGLFIIGVVTFLILYGSYLTYLPLLLGNTFAVSTLTIGLIMSVTSLTTAVTCTKISILSDKFSIKSILIIGFLSYTLAMLVIPFVTTLIGFVLPSLFFGFGLGITIPCIQSSLAELAPIKYRAAFLSLNAMFLRIGQTLGPLLMGAVYVTYGINGVFIAGAGLSFFMITIAVTMVRE